MQHCDRFKPFHALNKLLRYRFEALDTVALDRRLADPTLSPRLNQILVPLLSIVDSEQLRREIRETAGCLEQYLYRERSSSVEAGALEILVAFFNEEGRSPVTIAEVTFAFADKFGSDYDRPITNRFIGSVMRKRLRLAVCESHGIYVIPMSEASKVLQVAIRFGVIERDGITNGIST
jgi:hypothetical protein